MTYKLKSISAKNFGAFTEIECSFDPNLSYIVGKNGEGKSTIGVDVLWIVLQGIGQKSTSKDMTPVIAERYQVIGSAGKSARLSVTLHDVKVNKDILIKRKVTAEGTELSFEAEPGMVLDQKFLNNLFSEFLISPKRFLQLTPVQQSVALGIDLSAYDKELKSLKENFTLLNRDLKGIGTLTEVEEVKPVDVSALVSEKDRRTKFNEVQVAKNKAIDDAQSKLDTLYIDGTTNTVVAQDWDRLQNSYTYNREITTREVMEYSNSVLSYIKVASENLWKEIDAINRTIEKGKTYVKSLPVAEPLLDITELDNKIASASEINVNANRYSEYVKLRDKKAKLEKELEDNKNKQDEVSANRIEKIKSFNLPFSDLDINDDGELTLKGRYLQDQYFSTGELTMIIPQLIISSMKHSGRDISFPFVYVQDFSLLDDENQKKIVDFFTANGIQAVMEVVSSKPTGKPHEIFLKDNVIVNQ